MEGYAPYNASYVVSKDYTKELLMQFDGNLVMYCVNGTAGCSCAHPQYQGDQVCFNDGRCVKYYWCPYAATSTNGASGVELNGQSDGNLVLYQNYCTGPGTNCVKPARLGPTGNLPSGTNGRGSQTLKMQDDGNLVVYTGGGSAIWSTGTNYYNGKSGYPLCEYGHTIINGNAWCSANTPMGTVNIERLGNDTLVFFRNGDILDCHNDGSSCSFTTNFITSVCSGNTCNLKFHGNAPWNANGSGVCTDGSTGGCKDNIGNGTGCQFYDSGGGGTCPPRPPSVGPFIPHGADTPEESEHREEEDYEMEDFMQQLADSGY